MLRKVLVLITVFLYKNVNAQDVINDYISYVHIYFDNINYSIPSSYCNWNPWGSNEGSGEFRLRLDIEDFSQDFHSPSLEEGGWYKGPCFKKTDGDGTFDVYTNHTCYEITNNNFNQRLLQLDWQTLQWEEDPTPDDCRKNSGDDCLTEYDGTYTSAVDISSNNCRYGNTEYDFGVVIYDFTGSGGYNYFDIDYEFEIRPTIGTSHANAFEFIDFDPSSGCFSNVNHCLNTSNRTSDYVWYTFELNHRRSIEIDFSTQSPANNINSCYLKNTSLNIVNPSPQSPVSNIHYYYNLEPGVYYIELHRSNAYNSTGKYNLKINQLSVALSSVDHYWTGSYNENWFDPCNWSTNHVPDNDNDVIVPYTINKPVIYSAGNSNPDNANGHPSGEAHCNSIDIETSTVPPPGQSPAKVTIWNTAKLKVDDP